MHHTTISRLLRGHSAVPSRAIRSTGRALGLSVADIMGFIAVEETEAVIAAIRRPAFRPDSRQLAVAACVPLDNVNVALQTLLADRRLRMVSPSRWVTDRD